MNKETNKEKQLFGWKSAFVNYGICELCKDSIFPSVISILLCFIAFYNNMDMYNQVLRVIEIGLSIIPSMVAIILAGYAMILTFIIGEKFNNLERSGKCRLIEALNSNFAICLFFSIVSLVCIIVASYIANMEIKVENSNFYNYPVCFLLLYLMLFSVQSVFGIVINIFNVGQTTLTE